MKELKEKLGKVLLVFPKHSLTTLDAEYNVDEFINKINNIKKDYDTVLVCLFFADIQKGIHKKYENFNFQIVTAGHRFHKLFLERLKSIILLSDYTISNSFGTHTIYCTALNKPHSIFKQEIEIKMKKNLKNKKILLQGKKAYEEATREDKILLKQLDLINRVYSKYPNLDVLTQKKQTQKLFGYNEIKTKKEIFVFLNSNNI